MLCGRFFTLSLGCIWKTLPFLQGASDEPDRVLQHWEAPTLLLSGDSQFYQLRLSNFHLSALLYGSAFLLDVFKQYRCMGI